MIHSEVFPSLSSSLLVSLPRGNVISFLNVLLEVFYTYKAEQYTVHAVLRLIYLENHTVIQKELSQDYFYGS